MTPTQFMDSARAYTAWARGSITSYVRSPERNAQVGGHKDSSHLIGLACDIGYSPNPTPPLATAKRRARKLGLTLIRETSHEHLQAAE